MMNKEQIRRITENVVRRLIKEGLLNDDNIDDTDERYFKEYEQDYPDEDFEPKNITRDELYDYCMNIGDFLWISNYFGTNIRAANSSEIINEIANDIENSYELKHTHKYDYLLNNDNRIDFENYYVAVFEFIDQYGDKNAIIYTQEKY